jgi:replication fork clamp-binding protein CrfC
MDQLIPIVNRLQDVFHSVGMLDTIDLPQIAVVGSQSSGKSSVLENLVGRDFLPRGSGIVTRRPLVLQLNTVPKSDKGNDEWGEFLHNPKKKFYDFNEIRQEIVAETDRVTGSNKGISALPIHLKIYSPNVLNLTLIDLPGITKVPIGDQPKDIEEQLRKMILTFITKPNCIILAITPANADLANSDALKLAKAVDEKGVRTLGVLTKLDIMDQGTDAMDVLSGKVYPLRRGFIGVVNRGQKDIDANKKIKNALEDEVAYFQKHPSYGAIASRCGTPYLAKTLSNILLNHIRVCLPEIKTKIQTLMVQAQQRLSTYGAPLSETNMSPGAMLLQLLTQFSSTYVDCIDGRIVSQSAGELFGGARINAIFAKSYTPYLLKMEATEGLSDEDIKMQIRNAKGPRTSLFVPEAAFEILVKKQVRNLEEPSIHCVDQVFEELLTIIDYCDKDLTRFPPLRERVKEFVIQLLRNYVGPLKEFIRDLISIETAYVNTNHPDFFGGGATAIQLVEKLTQAENRKALQESQQLQQQQQSQGKSGPIAKQPVQQIQIEQSESDVYNQTTMDREKTDSNIIKALLQVYFGIVRKGISDSVPKAIMCFLVNKSKQEMQSELVKNMYREELFNDLLKENEEVAAKRKATAKMLEVLTKANQIINEVNVHKIPQ